MSARSIVLLVFGLMISVQSYGNEDTFDYPVFKTVTLPSFSNIQIPIYKSSGQQGPGILLVHGNSSSSRAFLFQYFLGLGQKYKIFLMDLPGHGNASKVDPSLPLPLQSNGLPLGFAEYQTGLVEAVATVANDPEVQAQVMVGWSLGGDVILLAQGLGLLPNTKGIFMFGTSPAGANAPSSQSPFVGPYVPNFPGLSILASFGFSFEFNAASPIGFDLYGQFTNPVPPYAPSPIADAANIGEAYSRAFFKMQRRVSGDIPDFVTEDAMDRSDDRFRASLGVIGLGLLPSGSLPLPDELQVMQNLQGDPNDPTDDIPLAVVVGEEDAFANVDYLKDLQVGGLMPTLWRSKVIEVPGAGHAVQLDKPFRFNKLLRNFVNSLN